MKCLVAFWQDWMSGGLLPNWQILRLVFQGCREFNYLTPCLNAYKAEEHS